MANETDLSFDDGLLSTHRTSDHPSCSVVILNYNGNDTIEALLRSVHAQTGCVCEIIVLDNCSTDGSDQIAKTWCLGNEKARYHQFEGNIGFARAMNWGIAHSSGDFICLLNVDILLDSNYIEECVEILANTQDVGMVSGIIYRLVKGEKTQIIDSLGLGLNINRYHDDIGAGAPANGIMRTTHPFGVCGCAPVYSRAMIESISQDEAPFLELFESYSEDVDLAWRARKRGWKAVCTHKTSAWHVREGSLTSRNLKSVARNRTHRNRIWLMVLNERPSIVLRHICYWLPIQTFFLVKAFVQPGLFVAYADAFLRMPLIINVRMKRNRRPSVLSVQEERRLFSMSKNVYRTRILKRIRNILVKNEI
jgi:GT2 family glycosyltransferase